MPNNRRHPKLIRINLADDVDPVAASVTVHFDKRTKKISFPGNSDVRVNLAGDNEIDFHLTTTSGRWGKAALAGVSFPGNTKSGKFAPSKVFSPDAGEIKGTHPSVSEKAYGATDEDGVLKLKDRNETDQSSGSEEYEYRIWVGFQKPGSARVEYYGSDPKIFNDPPPGDEKSAY